MSIQDFLTNHLTQAAQAVGIPLASPPQFSFDSKHADLSSNIALLAYSQLDSSTANFSSPIELAEKLLTGFWSSIGSGDEERALCPIKKAEVAGPGFINFWINDANLCSIVTSKMLFSHLDVSTKSKNPKKYLVEFSSPNIAKPFTIGHFRSTIIGHAVASLLEATGNTVYRDNHLGDWGTQFGKLVYAIKTWGDEAVLARSTTPVKDLVALYVKFHQEAEMHPELEEEGRRWFARLEQGDQEARRLWQLCVDWSWQEFERLYQLLRVSFTENNGRGYGESFFEDKMQPVIDILRQSGMIAVGEQGALMVEFEPASKLPPLMILKSDGASLYATRDLATDWFRKQHYGDNVTIINEVGIEQELYFRQLFAIESKLGWFPPEQRVHIKHGLYRFKDGKMSTRKGNVVWLQDVIEEAIKRAASLIVSDLSPDEKQEVAKKVGLGALKWNDLKSAPERSIAFEWDEVLSMQGNSGPYLQYSVARCNSILADREAGEFDPSLLSTGLTQAERALLVDIWRWPEVVMRAASEYAPHKLCTYLYELAQRFNHFYASEPILKSGNRIEFRLSLTEAVKKVLTTGLGILGIETPERM